MALYSYVKKRNEPHKRVVGAVSYMSIVVGSLFLFWSFYPILSFEIYSRLFIQNKINTPVPRNNVASALSEASSVLGAYNVFSTNLSDYTKAGLWFPKVQQPKGPVLDIKEYFLSIPKLDIKNAVVKVGGDDLSKSLIHYLPTSQPGQKGNVSIFGHSTLPQSYNVKDYKTIFTYLPSLNKGDNILLSVGDLTYSYEIVDMFVVSPDQVSVLDQKYDDSYVTLITCVPPGTWWKRLVVRAKLTQI